MTNHDESDAYWMRVAGINQCRPIILPQLLTTENDDEDIFRNTPLCELIQLSTVQKQHTTQHTETDIFDIVREVYNVGLLCYLSENHYFNFIGSDIPYVASRTLLGHENLVGVFNWFRTP
jgi:hypothetical protein